MTEASQASKERISDLESLGEFLKSQDNSQNRFYISPIPDICTEYPCLLGIDEAGRGPVFGPMVYGTAFIPINEQTLLETLECADSKALNEEKRNLIFSNICQNFGKIGWAVEVIAPMTICNSMLSRSKYSLNQVSMDSAINLVKAALNKGVKIEHVYVDTVGKPEKYQEYLKSLFPKLKITVAKKADSTYPIVSAASICAKVTRDHALSVWTFPEGNDFGQFGSGYPSDPVVKKFLIDKSEPVFGYPQLVRFSWATSANALKETAYHVDWEDAEDEPSPKNLSITNFFKMTNENAAERSQHEFFIQRCLSRKVEL